MLSWKCSCFGISKRTPSVNDQLSMSDSEGDELSDTNSNEWDIGLETEVDSSDELRRSMIFQLQNLYNHRCEFSHKKMLTMLDIRTSLKKQDQKINKSSICCGHIILRPVKLFLFLFFYYE